MNLAEMRARVRQDLHDEDDANYRWTDVELDRHIQHAVRELSLSSPLEVKAALTTTAGSRELSLVTLANWIEIEAVEYPVGKYPPSYVPFSLWANTLTLLVDNTPSGGEQVYIFYGKLHTLDASTSTLPPALEEMAAIGAEAYAALEWSSFATNRVNLGGSQTWRDYLTWGQDRLAAFAQGLARLGRHNAVRARHLYKATAPKPSQSTDWGP